MLIDALDGLSAKLVGLSWILLGIWRVTQSDVVFIFTIGATSTTILLNVYRFLKIKNNKNNKNNEVR